MRIVTNLRASVVAAMIASTGLAGEYGDLVAQGYRWVKIGGPYACPTRKDLREVTRNPGYIKKLQMVEGLRASFLIEGALVEVIKEDASAAMAQIRTPSPRKSERCKEEQLRRQRLSESSSA